MISYETRWIWGALFIALWAVVITAWRSRKPK